jgi:hypothetical protein
MVLDPAFALAATGLLLLALTVDLLPLGLVCWAALAVLIRLWIVHHRRH